MSAQHSSMNPLKTLLNKVFESAPPNVADPSKEDAPFEWNPEEETVAPTSSKASSWKRGDTPDEGPKHVPGQASDAGVAASAQELPAPMFEKPATARVPSGPVAPPVLAADPAPRVMPAPEKPAGEKPTGEKLVAEKPAPASPQAEPAAPAPATSIATRAQGSALSPLSDFEDVYRKAGIKSPVHGYGVERVYRLITSRRLVGLDRSVRRSALLTALDAAGVPASDVSQDAVLRRKALTAFEAEKALELQSLRSRNESRAEALQDTVETFTRQKQSQIERLAQGSTAAVRAQSDLEIRKRMEQDRLYRSLAYFVEALPSPAASGAQRLPPSAAIQRFDRTIEMAHPAEAESAPPVQPPAPRSAEVEVITLSPQEEESGGTQPIPSGLEKALQEAAQQSRAAGWGKPEIAADTAGDPVEALRKLREASKTESSS